MKTATDPIPSKASKTGITRLQLIVSIAILAIVAISLAVVLNRDNSDHQVAKIRVAYAPVVLNLPAYLAQDKEWFKEAGIEAEFTVFTSANDMINAVVARQVDAVTGVSLVPVLNLEAQYPGKIRVVLHSKMNDTQPFDGIVVKPASDIQTINDLAGRKLGIFPGTTAINWMRALFKKHGIDPAEVDMVQLPPASHLSALESGAIDALLAYEPTLTTALQNGNRRVFGSIYADLLNPSPISSTVISREFEAKNPETAAAFIRVLDRAISAIQQDPTESKVALTKFTKILPEVAPHVNVVKDTTSTTVDAENVQKFIELLVEIGELPKSVDAKKLLSQ